MCFTWSNNRTTLNLGFFCRLHIFTNWECFPQLSFWVIIILQYDIYVQDAGLDTLSPPVLQFAIQSLFIVSFGETLNFRRYSTANQWIVIRSRIGQWEVRAHLKLHIASINRIVIWSQIEYLIGAKVLSTQKYDSAAWYTWLKHRRLMPSPGYITVETAQLSILGKSRTEQH